MSNIEGENSPSISKLCYNYFTYMQVEKILEKLIKFNTVEDKENEKIVQWIFDFLKKRNFCVEVITDPITKNSNLVAYNKPLENVTLFFCGHMDTVPASSQWKSNPFKLYQKGDKLYGLGSCDMKGGIAAALAAIEQVYFKKARKGVGLIFTFDEEKEFKGMKYFVDQKKISGKKIIIMEPTDENPVKATKGAVAFRIEFIGKEAHGSVPFEGVNAIEMANIFIDKLKNSCGKFAKEKNDIFSPACATLNIARISGGDAINKVPARAVLDFELRTIKVGQNKRIIQEVKNILRQEKLKSKIEILMNIEPMINTGGEFVNMAEKISGKKSGSANYATEGALLARNNEVIILGPGPVNAHKADEFVSQKSLQKMVQVYKEMIEKICL